ncbi:MAG: recombinase family protein, partial [Oliverpabstia intestinalis]
MTYYKTYIEGHEDWEFVGMYSDEGITATNTKKRDGFNQMVEDALDGKFADGKGTLAYSRFLGYDKDFKINEEEAKVVRLIYRLFISGKSPYGVGKELERRKIPSPAGKPKWHASTVKSILTNEKYKGDALLQKQYTTDFLQKKRKKNEGEIPQYYVENHHEAIIPPPVFEYVQAEIVRRSKMDRYSGANIFANKVRCGCCGNWYGAKVWHSNDKYRRIIYRCNRKYQKGKEPCESPHYDEWELKEIFMKALNMLMEEKDECIANLQELIEDTCQIDDLEVQQESLEEEMELLAEKINSVIRENTRIVQDQEEYQKGKEPCESPHYDEWELKEIFMKALNMLMEEKDECIANLQELIE